MSNKFVISLALFSLAGCGGEQTDMPTPAESPDSPASAASTLAGDASSLINLLNDNEPVYGIFVPPNESGQFTAEAAAELGRNPYLDFLFLDLEGNPYDIQAVHAFVEGLATLDPQERKTLLVRIPTIDSAGYELTEQRTQEVLTAGADGIIYPHIKSVEMAERVKGFWAGYESQILSPDNPGGTFLTMLMVEDPEAIETVAEIADVGGYSMLSCGIGSLSSALGSPEAGEAGCLRVLAEGNRVGMQHLQLAMDTQMVQRRIEQGYRGLLMPMNDDMPNIVRAGWAATDRR